MLHAGLLGITAGPLNTLRRQDPQSGVGLWTLQLDSPAVAVHLADGTSLKLHGAAATSGNTSTVVVGTLQGSMYALPVAADWMQSALPAVPVTETIRHQSPGAASAASDESIEKHLSRSMYTSPAQPHPLDRASPQLDGQHYEDVQVSGFDMVGKQIGETRVTSDLRNGRVNQASAVDRQPTGKQRQAQKAASDSKALVQVPVRPATGPEAHWQCPVSLHSVATTSAPQSFLPNLTDLSTGAEEVAQAVDETTWAGKSLESFGMFALLVCTAYTFDAARDCGVCFVGGNNMLMTANDCKCNQTTASTVCVG